MAISRQHQEARDNLAKAIRKFRSDDDADSSHPMYKASDRLLIFETVEKSSYTWQQTDQVELSAGLLPSKEEVCFFSKHPDFFTVDEALRTANLLLGWCMYVSEPVEEEEDDWALTAIELSKAGRI